MSTAALLTVAEDPRTAGFFEEFVRYERAVGGPDPHMATFARMVATQGAIDRADWVWAGGCYIGVYNVPTAEQIYRAFGWPEVLGRLDEIEPWLEAHWAGVATRRERRAVRRPFQLARFLREYAEFTATVLERSWAQDDVDPCAAYIEAWDDVQAVYSLGRYVALKVLEWYRRYVPLRLELPDLRAEGGWSPRQGLVLLRPDLAPLLLGGDEPAAVTWINRFAEAERLKFGERTGIVLDRYNWQVLLCDAKQALVGQRQFPGRSLDSEIEYAAQVAPHWPASEAMWDARRSLFPAVALGEQQGWSGVRKELGKVVAQHGYTWTDTKFDYCATQDLAQPALRL